MGIYLSTVVKQFARIFNSDKSASIVIVGLASAGKSSLVDVLKNPDVEVIHTVPTVGHVVETINYKNLISLHLWDLGGQDRLQPLWVRYYLSAEAVIFVIDSAEADRFLEVKAALESVLQAEELRLVPILILANKQDLVPEEKVKQMLEMFDVSHIAERHIKVFQCSILRKEGIEEAMNWLLDALRHKHS